MSTFYDPTAMQQYSASQGYQAPETGSPYTADGGAGVAQSSYNPMGMYQPGSQSGSLQGSGMNPYMLDTFGMGQYYQPYGNQMQQPLQQQMQGPQQPYYQVPTEYIPEGTPGLNQQPTAAPEPYTAPTAAPNAMGWSEYAEGQSPQYYDDVYGYGGHAIGQAPGGGTDADFRTRQIMEQILGQTGFGA